MRTPRSPLLLDSVVIDLQVHTAQAKNMFPLALLIHCLFAAVSLAGSDSSGQRGGYATAPVPVNLAVDHHSVGVLADLAATGHSLALRQTLSDSLCGTEKDQVCSIQSCQLDVMSIKFNQESVFSSKVMLALR